MTSKERSAPARHPLVGHWFHTYDAKNPQRIVYQGQILKSIEPDSFLVQLYDWILGSPGKQRLARLSQMAAWTFYDSAADMQAAYEEYNQPRHLSAERSL